MSYFDDNRLSTTFQITLFSSCGIILTKSKLSSRAKLVQKRTRSAKKPVFISGLWGLSSAKSIESRSVGKNSKVEIEGKLEILV